MLNLSNRIARLERTQALRSPQPCAECGIYPKGLGPPPKFRVTFDDDGSGPKWCGTCGQQLVYALQFDRAG